MRKSRAKLRTVFRIEILAITESPATEQGGARQDTRTVLVQEVASLNLPAVLSAINS